MNNCTVISYHGVYLVEFEDGKSILLQSDYDQAQFAVDCLKVEAPEDWDGCPSKLGKAWIDCELTDIEECPDFYYDIATVEKV